MTENLSCWEGDRYGGSHDGVWGDDIYLSIMVIFIHKCVSGCGEIFLFFGSDHFGDNAVSDN